MSTGDGINKAGAYANVQATDANVVTGDMSGGATVTIAAAIPAEQEYFLLDFQVVVTGSPASNGYLPIYKRPSDGVTPAPAPVGTTYEHIHVGSIDLQTSAGTYYLRGVVNDDPNDTYYVQNRGGDTLGLTLNARGRTYRVE